MLSQSPAWADPVKVRKVGPFSWHHLGHLCDAADLIIVPQEIKYLRLHLLLLATRFSQCKFAYWGHGKNFQAINSNSISERLKRFLSRHVDWWFAYNNLSAGIVRDLGFPSAKVTTVGNSIDTAALAKARADLSSDTIKATPVELGIQSQNVAVYTGGLYPNKRISFLLEAAEAIRDRVSDFELIIIGDGPDRDLAAKAASRNPWIHVVGAKNDSEKIPYWAMSKILLMPGGVGLVILDSFALGVPMVTTDTYLHGPEIDYLNDGHNGIMVACGDSSNTYAKVVVNLLRDQERLNQLRNGACASALHHDIETMVKNFSEGIVQALETLPGHKL
jgi:glycosyltransferase involved in cell wall biosynthesis